MCYDFFFIDEIARSRSLRSRSASALDFSVSGSFSSFSAPFSCSDSSLSDLSESSESSSDVSDSSFFFFFVGFFFFLTTFLVFFFFFVVFSSSLEELESSELESSDELEFELELEVSSFFFFVFFLTTFFFFFFGSFFDSSLAFFLSTFDFFLDDSTLSDFLDFLLTSELFLSLSLDLESLRVFFLSFDEERDRLRFDFDLERLK